MAKRIKSVIGVNEIVLGFIPSDKMKDWQFGWDKEGNVCYTQNVMHYCTKHWQVSCDCPGKIDSAYRNIGKEPYFNMKTKKVVPAPRIWITHHPKKGEWEHLKITQDLRDSPLFKEHV